MAVAATALGHGVRVDGCNIAFELGVLAGCAVNGEMGFEDLATVAFLALDRFAHRAEHELRIRGIEVFAQCLD